MGVVEGGVRERRGVCIEKKYQQNRDVHGKIDRIELVEGSDYFRAATMMGGGGPLPTLS